MELMRLSLFGIIVLAVAHTPKAYSAWERALVLDKDNVFYEDSDSGAGTTSDSFATMNAPAGTDPAADSSTDTLNLTVTGPINITGDSTTDTLAFEVANVAESHINWSSMTDLDTGGVVRANAVALTTDTTGNYAAGDAEAGAALTGDSATNFFSSGVMDSSRFNWDSVPAETITRAKINWSTLWTDSASGINWGAFPGSSTDYVLKKTATGVNWQADLTGAGGGDEVSVNGGAVTNPNFASTGTVSFTDTANTVTANINWTAVGSQAIQSSKINWVDVDAQEIQRAGINWSSITNDVKLTGINWDAFWTDSASGINWGKVPGATTDYVLKRTASGINWQASTGGAETNSLETITTGIASTEIPIGTAADTVVYAALSGDVTMTNAGVVSIGNDKVVEADLKAVDAASDEDILTYESTTGDFEWHTISEMIALMSAGALPNDSVVEADLKAVDAASDEECLTYETTTGDFEWQSCGSGSGGAKIIQLNPYSAKITGAYVTATITSMTTATQGAQIDAGDGNWRVLFDATTDEAAVFYGIVPDNYTSTPVVKLIYSMVSATTGEVEWEAAVMCVTPGDAADIGTASFAAGAASVETVPGTAGHTDTLVSITPTDDSCASSDLIYVWVSTDAGDAGGNDDATGDRELVGAYVSYT